VLRRKRKLTCQRFRGHFFYLTELPIRWGRSLPEITGWALAGRLNLMVPIAPVQCGIERVSGIVRVRAEDVARLFHPDHPIHLSCAVIRILPTGALDPVYVTDPAAGIEVRLRDLMLDAEEVSDFEQVNDLLGIGTRSTTEKDRVGILARGALQHTNGKPCWWM